MPVVAFIPLIVAGVQAASQVVAAKKASSAAKAAAETQAGAAAAATASAKEALGPYMETGSTSRAMLGSMLGVPAPAAVNTMNGGNVAQPRPVPSRIPTMDTSIGTMASAGRGGGTGAPPQAYSSGSSYGTDAAPAGGMALVKLRAPDGSVRDVPQCDVSGYVARGAVPVSNASAQAMG